MLKLQEIISIVALLSTFWCNVYSQEVSQNPIPYHVSIQLKLSNKELIHICAGSILHEEIILTAAHCFMKYSNPKNLYIIPGSSVLNISTKHPIYQVVKIVKHRNFYPLQGYDVALLKIQTPLKFDSFVDKINIKPAIELNDKEDIYLIGWITKEFQKEHIKIPFRIIQTEKCRKGGYAHLQDTDICALAYQNRGACDGDSGGPLINQERNVQLGILSYGKTICKPGKIYVFTRIKPLMEWIEIIMSQLLK